MTLFWLGALGLSVVALLAIFWPWLLKARNQEADQERLNVLLVKDRVSEIQRDMQEGILTDEDKQAAESELKQALVQEVESTEGEGNQEAVGSRISPVLIVFTFIAIAGVVAAYIQSNEISSIQNWKNVHARLPELGERVIKGDPTLTAQEYQDFALGLRTKLAEKPDDAVGWLLLGRL